MIRYAFIFLIISLIAGAVGLTRLSTLARRIALGLFALFFLGFLLLIALAMIVDASMKFP